MKAGELRHKVTLQQMSTTRDSFGAVVETWADVATVWAAIEPAGGRETLAGQEVTAEVTHRVRIRYRADVTPEMRANFQGRVFDIQAVLNVDGRGRELHLLCKEMV